MKKINIYKLVTLSLMAGCFFIRGTNVGADELNKIVGLKQTESKQSEVKFSYNQSLDKISRYVIEFSYDGTTFKKLGTTSSTEYSVKKLSPGTKYYVRVRSEYGKESSPVSDTLQLVTSPNAVEDIRQTAATRSSVTIEWTPSQGSDYYILTDKTGKVIGKTSETSFTVEGYQNTEKFPTTIHVIATTSNGVYEAKNEETDYDKSNYIANLKLVPGKTTGLRRTDYDKDSGTVKYANDKILYADGYQYEVYNDATGKKVATFSSTATSSSFGQISTLDNCIKKRTWYRIKARAYLNIDKTTYYGEWSDWDYVAPPVGAQATRKDRKAIKLTWNTVRGSDRYAVYVSKNSKSKYVLVKNTTKLSYTVRKMGKRNIKRNQKYFIRVKAVKKVGNATYYGYTKTIRKK